MFSNRWRLAALLVSGLLVQESFGATTVETRNETLHHAVLWFCAVSLVLVFSVVGILAIVTYRKRTKFGHHRTKIELVDQDWPEWAKELVGTGVLLFVIVPFVIILLSTLFGGIFAMVEGWTFFEGFEYILMNVAALETQLNQKSPTTLVGEICDIAMSLWAMLIATAFMGVAGSLGFVQRVIDRMPGSVWGLCMFVFLVIPAALVVITLLGAVGISACESWSLKVGFLFMISSLCGLATPLVDNDPQTGAGIFMELLSTTLELTLGGAIIGVLGAHPVLRRFVGFLEGQAVTVRALSDAELDEDKIQGPLSENAESSGSAAPEFDTAQAWQARARERCRNGTGPLLGVAPEVNTAQAWQARAESLERRLTEKEGELQEWKDHYGRGEKIWAAVSVSTL